MEAALFRVAVLCIILSASKCTRAELDNIRHSPVVQTESGSVVGKIESLPLGKSAFEYLGIPFAEPPVGDLRFAAPKPVKPWSGIREATEYGGVCPRPGLPMSVEGLDPEPESEDCLFLNVFVPSTIKAEEKMAVMVWIHGGGFAYGSSTEYPGGLLATFNDVIVVTISYRLGVLGFFNVPGTDIKGNYGMLDQVQALKWVQANIGSFGGDANRVTIFGQSAGGISVSLLLISPLSKGLFQRAITQSGPASYALYSGKVENTNVLETFSRLVNCSMGPELVDCVRSKSVKSIMSVQNSITFPAYIGPQDLAGPVVDGEFLPDLPEKLFESGEFHDVDVIAGFASNEGALFAILPPDQINNGVKRELFESTIKGGIVFVRGRNKLGEELVLQEYTDYEDPYNKLTLRKSMLNCFGDYAFVAPILLQAKALAKGRRPPFVYLYDHSASYCPFPEWIGVGHGFELGFVFGAPFKTLSSFLTMLTPRFSEIEKGLSLYMMKLWTDFAKYGTPTQPGTPPSVVTWPQFTEEEQDYLVLDLKPRVKKRYRADKVEFWNKIFSKVIQVKEEEEADTDKKTSKDEL